VLRKLSKGRFEERTPEEFALAWDARVNKLRGYRAVERAREDHVAAGILKAAADHRSVLALVEVERMAGVVAAFDNSARALEAVRPPDPTAG
jgi:hypothetical protein